MYIPCGPIGPILISSSVGSYLPGGPDGPCLPLFFKKNQV